MVFEHFATMMTNVSIMGAGIAFPLVALLFGASRGMTKNHEMWALIFSALAWVMALIIPNATFAATIFIAGAISITLAYTPFLKHLNESNIYAIAVVALMMNIALLVGTGAFSEAQGWSNNLEDSEETLSRLFGKELVGVQSEIPEHEACTPSSIRSGECVPKALSGSFSHLIFDVFASVLNIGDYIGKAIRFAGMAVVAPFIIAVHLQNLVSNSFIALLMGLYVVLWDLVILYNLIKVILNKRGMA